jgi:EAL domain-containing protein (putative c-di-GMP-specific phosphodiesterase class I)
VVAQGIETSAQLETLRSIGCELGQGDLLSGALEAEQALAHVDEHVNKVSVAPLHDA